MPAPRLRKVWLGGAEFLLTDEQYAKIHGVKNADGSDNVEARSEANAIAFLQDQGVIPADFEPMTNTPVDSKTFHEAMKQLAALKAELAQLKKSRHSEK